MDILCRKFLKKINLMRFSPPFNSLVDPLYILIGKLGTPCDRITKIFLLLIVSQGSIADCMNCLMKEGKNKIQNVGHIIDENDPVVEDLTVKGISLHIPGEFTKYDDNLQG